MTNGLELATMHKARPAEHHQTPHTNTGNRWRRRQRGTDHHPFDSPRKKPWKDADLHQNIHHSAHPLENRARHRACPLPNLAVIRKADIRRP